MSDKPELVIWKKNQDEVLEGWLGNVLWCEFIPEDKEEGITTAAYVYGIAIDGWMLDADIIEQAKPLVDEWTRNWMSRADLAKPSEWISVDDRLPEESGSYFACLENDMVTEFNFSDIGARPYWFKVGFGSEVEENKVTHWQHLPSPPEITP